MNIEDLRKFRNQLEKLARSEQELELKKKELEEKEKAFREEYGHSPEKYPPTKIETVSQEHNVFIKNIDSVIWESLQKIAIQGSKEAKRELVETVENLQNFSERVGLTKVVDSSFFGLPPSEYYQKTSPPKEVWQELHDTTILTNPLFVSAFFGSYSKALYLHERKQVLDQFQKQDSKDFLPLLTKVIDLEENYFHERANFGNWKGEQFSDREKKEFLEFKSMADSYEMKKQLGLTSFNDDTLYEKWAERMPKIQYNIGNLPIELPKTFLTPRTSSSSNPFPRNEGTDLSQNPPIGPDLVK